MSKRPTLDKQVARLRKALKPGLPTFIDLEDWLVTRKHAKSKREARELLLAGKVRVESHVVGRIEVDDKVHGDENGKRFLLYPYLPAQYRADLTVTK